MANKMTKKRKRTEEEQAADLHEYNQSRYYSGELTPEKLEILRGVPGAPQVGSDGRVTQDMMYRQAPTETNQYWQQAMAYHEDKAAQTTQPSANTKYEQPGASAARTDFIDQPSPQPESVKEILNSLGMASRTVRLENSNNAIASGYALSGNLLTGVDARGKTLTKQLTPQQVKAIRTESANTPQQLAGHTMYGDGQFTPEVAKYITQYNREQEKAKAIAKNLADDTVKRDELIKQGRLKLEYSKSQQTEYKNINQQIEDARANINERINPKQAAELIDELTKKKQYIQDHPEERLKNPSGYVNEPGSTVQKGMSLSVADKDGILKETYRMKGDDLSKFSDKALGIATTKTPNLDEKGNRKIDQKTGDPLDDITNVDWATYALNMRSYLSFESMANGLDIKQFMDPASEEINGFDIIMQQIPLDQQEEVAKKLGWETPKAKQERIKQAQVDRDLLASAEAIFNKNPELYTKNGVTIEDIAKRFSKQNGQKIQK